MGKKLWAKLGQKASKSLKNNNKIILSFFVPADFLLKRCFFNIRQQLAPKLDVVRMVCENIRPTRPKQPMKPPPLHFFVATVPNLETVRPVAILGLFLILTALTSGASATEAWKTMGQSTHWETKPTVFGSAPFGQSNNSKTAKGRLVIPSRGLKVDRLLAVIGAAEAPRGYDEIHYSASRLPKKNPRVMTLGEIERWVKATPGQHHAIGRYQIIPQTFASLKRKLRLSDEIRFDEQTQDLMDRYLLAGLLH